MRSLIYKESKEIWPQIFKLALHSLVREIEYVL